MEQQEVYVDKLLWALESINKGSDERDSILM